MSEYQLPACLLSMIVHLLLFYILWFICLFFEISAQTRLFCVCVYLLCLHRCDIRRRRRYHNQMSEYQLLACLLSMIVQLLLFYILWFFVRSLRYLPKEGFLGVYLSYLTLNITWLHYRKNRSSMIKFILKMGGYLSYVTY